MIATLFSYEFRATRNLLGLIFAVCTLVTGVGALLAAIGWPIIAQFGIGLGILGPIGLLYAVQIALVVLYYQSSYGRGGYLTHSVPVKGSSVFWVKLLYASLVSLLSWLWGLVLAFVAWLGVAAGSSLNVAEPFRALARVWPDVAAIVPAWMWIVLVMFIPFSQIASFAPYFFAISVGSEARFGRLGLGGPVLMWFIMYTVMQIVMLIAILVIPLGIGLVDGRLGFTMADFVAAITTGSEPQSMPIGYLPALILAIVALLWRTAVSWNRKVSLN